MMPPIFYFRSQEEHGGVCNELRFPLNRHTAWKEMTGVCSDIVADASRKLVENAEWQISFWTSPGAGLNSPGCRDLIMQTPWRLRPPNSAPPSWPGIAISPR